MYSENMPKQSYKPMKLISNTGQKVKYITQQIWLKI